jgi:hypothetical protein
MDTLGTEYVDILFREDLGGRGLLLYSRKKKQVRKN